MVNKRIAIILVNYKDYANKYLADCLLSLRQQNYAGEMKIFIVDNESTEKSHGYLKNIALEAEIIRNENNDGFAKGNNDAMKIAIAQGFDYIILFNLDTVIENNCISELVKAAQENLDCFSVPTSALKKRTECLRGNYKKEVGAVQARLMLWPEKDKINSLGNVTHFLGFGYSRGYGEKYGEPHPNPCLPDRQALLHKERDICYPSGAAVLFKAKVLKKIGLFDEEFWMYNEDQDLGWRIWLSGFSCVLAPQAVVYHKYEFSRSIKKYYFMDRNRLIAILKNYRLATLILILPALSLMEIGLIFFAYKNGWFYEKMKVYSYFLNLANWRKIIAERKKIQKLRTVKDGQIVKMFSGKIWYQEIGERRLKVANVIFNTYWKSIRGLIRW